MPSTYRDRFGILHNVLPLTPSGRTAEVFAQLDPLGFVWEHTGGGCTALVRTDADGSLWVLTDEDASVPESMLSPCVLGHYASDDDFYSGEMLNGTDCYYPCVVAAVKASVRPSNA